MGLKSFIEDQFLDVIEYEDLSNKILVFKYTGRENNEIKHGAKVIVREGQICAFVKGGVLADILSPGTHRLDTDNLPVLSSLKAIPYLLNSPIKSDLYFISTKQLTGNKWATKNPIMMRDRDFGVMRLRAFGTYVFRISDPELFMREVFGSLCIVTTWDIVQHLASYIPGVFSEVISELSIPALDLASSYRMIADAIKNKVNEECAKLGVIFESVVIENISLPDKVQKQIDETSGMYLVADDMNTYSQYQSIHAMRDAAKQKGGLAGLGAGFALGKQMMNQVSSTSENKNNDPIEELMKYKKLLDSGIITQEEFDKLKAKILKL